MKTTKPFSTISYNTSDFLLSKLNPLVDRRIISWYGFIRHYAEQDEKKDHIHLLIIPNGQIQTDSLSDILQELDPSDPSKKPLGVMPWRSSKFGDWYLYITHDSAYLASKGQTRQHHYQESDIISSDPDFLHELVTTIDRSIYAKTRQFVESIKNGASFVHMLENGQIPAPQFKQWEALYTYFKDNSVYRNGNISHTPAFKVDEKTGEVLDSDKQ